MSSPCIAGFIWHSVALGEKQEILFCKWAGQHADTLCLGQLMLFIWQG